MPDIVRELENLPPEQLLKMLKNIRALSGDVLTLEGIQKSGAIQTFIKFLERRSGKFLVEICTTVLMIMYNFCKISKKRQEYAAASGLVPHLIYFSSSKRDGPPQLGNLSHPFSSCFMLSPSNYSFLFHFYSSLFFPLLWRLMGSAAMEMLCDFAHSEKCRPYLKKHHVLHHYLNFLVLSKSYISVNALEAIAVWLGEDKEMEAEIAKKVEVDKIVHMFKVAPDGSMLAPLLKILSTSDQISAKLGENTTFVTLLVERLSHRDAFVKLNLLKILKPILVQKTISPELIKSKVLPTMKHLEEDEGMVLVKNMAKQIRELVTQ